MDNTAFFIMIPFAIILGIVFNVVFLGKGSRFEEEQKKGSQKNLKVSKE